MRRDVVCASFTIKASVPLPIGISIEWIFSENWPLQTGFQEKLLSASTEPSTVEDSARYLGRSCGIVSGDIVLRTTIADNEANRRRKRTIVATPARPSKKGVAAAFELDGTAETTGRSV